MKVTLTDGELEVLDQVVENSFFDGCDSELWLDVFVDEVASSLDKDEKAVGGWLTSLQSKGIVDVWGRKGEGVVTIQPVGWAILTARHEEQFTAKDRVKCASREGYSEDELETIRAALAAPRC